MGGDQTRGWYYGADRLHIGLRYNPPGTRLITQNSRSTKQDCASECRRAKSNEENPQRRIQPTRLNHQSLCVHSPSPVSCKYAI
jgi:hypothetical protein